MTHYLALTIGPFDRTLQATRSTRAMWSASYLFSWVMKNLAKELSTTEGVYFIAPYIGKVSGKDPFTDILQVGLFHDRLIIQADKSQLENFNKAVQKVVGDLAKMIVSTLGSDPKVDVLAYLQDYLQLHVLEIESDSNTVFEDISAYLDTLEVQSAFVEKETEPFLTDFFEYINSDDKQNKYNSFINAEFAKEGRFPSTAEIATADLAQQSNYDAALKILREEEKSLSEPTAEKMKRRRRQLKYKKEIDTQIAFYEKISSLSKARQRHKYIAVVQADGDKMGSFIQSINKKNTGETDKAKRFEPFSRQLMIFSLAAVDNIKAFGATPIYAGGDDLLFFTPLVGKTGKSFLTLIEDLDAVFETEFLENPDIKPFIDADSRPSLSYGVSITYYKFPIGESQPRAYHHMKSAKNNGRNAVFFEVQKHSGQQFGGIFSKTSTEFTQLKNILETELDAEKVEQLISSVTYKLDFHAPILRGIAQNKISFAARLEDFFTNNFNESIHKTASVAAYLKNVQALIISVFDGFLPAEGEKTFEKRMEKIYAALRLAHFISSPFKEESER